jgi:hypothetical protein
MNDLGLANEETHVQLKIRANYLFPYKSCVEPDLPLIYRGYSCSHVLGHYQQ